MDVPSTESILMKDPPHDLVSALMISHVTTDNLL